MSVTPIGGIPRTATAKQPTANSRSADEERPDAFARPASWPGPEEGKEPGWEFKPKLRAIMTPLLFCERMHVAQLWNFRANTDNRRICEFVVSSARHTCEGCGSSAVRRRPSSSALGYDGNARRNADRAVRGERNLLRWVH